MRLIPMVVPRIGIFLVVITTPGKINLRKNEFHAKLFPFEKKTFYRLTQTLIKGEKQCRQDMTEKLLSDDDHGKKLK